MNRVEVFDNRQDMVTELIRTGRYDLIPASRMSQNFEDANPWPPPQFTDITDETKFCTWCGETVQRWLPIDALSAELFENRHYSCPRYGKHCRHKDLAPDAYYMRVWSFGRSGRHHYDPAKVQTMMVQNLESGVLQLVSPKTYQPPLQESMWKHRAALDNSDYDQDYDCGCVCDVCYDEDDDKDTGKHCGQVEIGCDKAETIDEDNLDDCFCDCDFCADGKHCGDHFMGCHEKAYVPERFKHTPWYKTPLVRKVKECFL